MRHEREAKVIRQLIADWYLYGEIHMTNANGLTRLDPRRVTYADPEPEVVDAGSRPSAILPRQEPA